LIVAGYSCYLIAMDAPITVSVEYGFLSSIVHAGFVEKLVIVFLLGFSILSWAIMGYKWLSMRRAYQDSTKFLEIFWGAKRLDSIYEQSTQLMGSPLSQVFRAGYVELGKLIQKGKPEEADTQLGALESIERSMRRTAAAELTKIESLVSFLATTGSATPFIGLFGTVIGIMNSFQDIGKMGNANLATVAPGIGGALVATAFGLFAAIPAVIAYNYFVSRIRVMATEIDGFSSDFLNIVKRHFF